MTYNRPEGDAVCWFVNGAERPVDVYVNYHDEAYATVKPEEDQGAFSIDSDADGVYGTYTLEAREKDDPTGPVLAAASVGFEAGDGYVAAFHRAGPDEFQLSVYEVDFSPTAESRLSVHHVASPDRIDWTLAPHEEADPRIEADERGGSLERGQWQRAVDVIENEYRLEVLVDGEVVAYRADVGLEAERATACFVGGDLSPEASPAEMQASVFSKRFQVPSGPDREDETTAPGEPHSAADHNQRVEYAFEAPDLFETERGEVVVRATDPDGVVTGLALDAVEPGVEGVRLLEDTVRAAPGVGVPATATLLVSADVPPGTYEARVVANPDGMGERAVGTVDLEVQPVTPERLWDRVTHHHASGAVSDGTASDLLSLLREAGASPEGFGGVLSDVLSLFESVGGSPDREATDRRGALEEFVAVASERRGDGIDEAAAADVVSGAEAALGRLDGE